MGYSLIRRVSCVRRVFVPGQNLQMYNYGLLSADVLYSLSVTNYVEDKFPFFYPATSTSPTILPPQPKPPKYANIADVFPIQIKLVVEVKNGQQISNPEYES